MAGSMAADTSNGLPVQEIEVKVETLLDAGYPLSEEQIAAIRHATARGRARGGNRGRGGFR